MTRPYRHIWAARLSFLSWLTATPNWCLCGNGSVIRPSVEPARGQTVCGDMARHPITRWGRYLEAGALPRIQEALPDGGIYGFGSAGGVQFGEHRRNVVLDRSR